MKQYRIARPMLRTPHQKRGAFTLVEVLVALAVMMVMMTIILVPINMGMSVFHIGKARSEVQQANQLVINQLAAELKQAVRVLPNEEMPGITTKAPYNGAPYYDSATTSRVSNTSRLDFLLPALSANGTILTPPLANNYLVTYYARRLKPKQADEVTDNPYDVFSNPVVLWRAQYPYTGDTGGSVISSPYTAANLTSSRYSNWSDLSNRWLIEEKGEPNLALKPSSTDPALFTDQDIASARSASHTQLTPRDMVLIVTDPTTSLRPDSTFICNDTDVDGKIDRVTISLLLGKYDSLGADGDKRQQIRSTQMVALPNIN